MYIALFLSFVSCSNHNHGPSCAGITQLMRPGGNAFPHWPLLWHSRSSEVITSPLHPQHTGTVPTKTPFFRHQLRGTSLFFIRAPGIHEVKFAHPSLVSLIYLPCHIAAFDVTITLNLCKLGGIAAASRPHGRTFEDLCASHSGPSGVLPLFKVRLFF